MTFERKYGVAATIDGVHLIERGAVDFKSNPTLATGDAKISKDGGALANLTTLPAVTPASSRCVRISLSATEMQAARIVVELIDQTSPKEWEDQVVIIETYGNASAQHAFDRDTANVTVESLEGTARVVQQLRVLNRPQPDEARVPVRLNELVERALVLTQKRGLDQRVEVVWEPGEGLEALPIMPLALQQVFHNLIVNAFQAMPEGGQLRVTTARTLQPDGVSIAFADTGCGIAPEMRTHLFDAFHSTKSEGVGLGLFISHNIVLQHEGRIEVESEVDQGTTFTIWLPRLPREQPSSP